MCINCVQYFDTFDRETKLSESFELHEKTKYTQLLFASSPSSIMENM